MPSPIPSPLRSTLHWFQGSHLRLLLAGLVAVGLIAAVSTFAAGDFESGEEQTVTITETSTTETQIELPPYTAAQIVALKNQVEKYVAAVENAKQQLATAKKNNKPASIKVAQQKLNQAQQNLQDAKRALATANGKLDEFNKQQQQKQEAGKEGSNGKLSFITSQPNVSVTFKCTGGENKTVSTNGSGQAGPFNATSTKAGDTRECWSKVGIPAGYQLVEGNKREVTKTVKAGQSVTVKWNFEPVAADEPAEEEPADTGGEGQDTDTGNEDNDQDSGQDDSNQDTETDEPTSQSSNPPVAAVPADEDSPAPQNGSGDNGTQGGGSQSDTAGTAGGAKGTLPASGTETMAIVLTFLALAAIYYGTRKYLLKKRGK